MRARGARARTAWNRPEVRTFDLVGTHRRNAVTIAAGALTPIDIDWGQALVRFLCAVLLPLAIGTERFLRRKPIDFRPFVIISVASCALTMGGLQLAYRGSDPQLSIDPTRIFAGVITGIGFLGAGAVFREGNHLVGSGSAAAIWAAGAIGILSGAGLLWLAGVVGILVLAVLLLSDPIVTRSAGDDAVDEGGGD
jgi:putative Mg2+ transporter-C (MgtC) family protein